MIDSTEILREYLSLREPTLEQARAVFTPLTIGEYDEVLVAALLATIRTRGETYEDIAGAAQAFLHAGRPFPVTGEGLLDTAGTGGDGANTINISTGASLAAAAGGCTLVKCGNRSVSSKSGSADVLEALNIPLDLDVDRAVRQLEASRFTFLFAPAYNPAIAYVQGVRKALKVSTLFNTLGPLLSPARPEFQIMGIARPELGEHIINVMKLLGRKRAVVMHGAGTDEFAVHGPTKVWELSEGTVRTYEVLPSDLGVGTYSLDDLAGGDGAENARSLRDVFAGTAPDAHRDAIAANTGAMFYVTGRAASFAEGTEQAQQLLADGSVAAWLQEHEEADYGA